MNRLRKAIGERTVVGLFAVWLAMIFVFLGWLITHTLTSGAMGVSPTELGDIPNVNFDSTLPRLWMFTHPHCPCTRTSIVELAKVLERSTRPVVVELVLVDPGNAGNRWEDSPLSSYTRSIPGVRLSTDAGGDFAQRMGARTSGHVMLYDADGRLQFSGGVTCARGHEGESLGSRAIVALLRGELENITTTPVFGCPLFASSEPCLAKPACDRESKELLP